jgi:hypothetical protein
MSRITHHSSEINCPMPHCSSIGCCHYVWYQNGDMIGKFPKCFNVYFDNDTIYAKCDCGEVFTDQFHTLWNHADKHSQADIDFIRTYKLVTSQLGFC